MRLCRLQRCYRKIISYCLRPYRDNQCNFTIGRKILLNVNSSTVCYNYLTSLIVNVGLSRVPILAHHIRKITTDRRKF